MIFASQSLYPGGRKERAGRTDSPEKTAAEADEAREDGLDIGIVPEQESENVIAPEAVPNNDSDPALSWKILAGSDAGLYTFDSTGKIVSLWSGGTVKKIIRCGGEEDSRRGPWVMLTDTGIFVSENLSEWENRSGGLPVKTIKIFQDGEKSFLSVVQDIKDIAINPDNADIMVCATKDSVYLSRDGGRLWNGLGSPPYRTNGIKAVAAAYMVRPSSAPSAAESEAAGELTVFLSHSTYGVFYTQPDRPGAKWIEMNGGLETLETTGNADEVACFAVTPFQANGGGTVEIFVSQTFRRRIYRLDWNTKTFTTIWSDNSSFGTVDSLSVEKDRLVFLYEGTAASVDFSGGTFAERQELVQAVKEIPLLSRLNCAAIIDNVENNGGAENCVTLNELYLLSEPEPETAAATPPADGRTEEMTALASDKEGLYLPVNHSMDPTSLKPYLDVINRSGLNMIVIDMKDDYGRLRFTPNNEAVTEKGRVFRPLDIDAFLGDMKERNIYTVARVVVFKDPELAGKEDGKFAIWDARTGKPWAGYYDSRRKKSDITDEERRSEYTRFFAADDPAYEIVRTFYDERWVDPYSEEVWEYNAAVAEELYERGFDEIQFDYIRFPTDGVNMGDARYRWQENGMDMESAILSFLRHIRRRVQAPISIDIYGANGWYRTGARTGQEVELLAPWVDVICPMYYPSHFEQHFLAQNPTELRPRRIYFQGTLRTARIGRGRVIIRPYAQAFYLNVSYDRRYYNADYVRLQLEGVRAAGSGGLTYWNNSGRYDDLPDK